MWAYRSDRVGVVPERFAGHHVSAVCQERSERLEPHPTDMAILNDADAAAYPRELIAGRLAREQLVMGSLLTDESFSSPAEVGSVIGGG
jgi:8-oxo-dGTP diphosphatase